MPRNISTSGQSKAPKKILKLKLTPWDASTRARVAGAKYNPKIALIVKVTDAQSLPRLLRRCRSVVARVV